MKSSQKLQAVATYALNACLMNDEQKKIKLPLLRFNEHMERVEKATHAYLL